MSLALKAGALALVSLLLAGCTEETTRRYWRTAAPVVGAIVGPQPAPTPEKPRKTRRPVTKD